MSLTGAGPNTSLLAEIKALRLQNDEVARRLEEEKRRREEAERQREEVERQVKELNRQTRPTTLYELLEFCYQHIDLRFAVETNPALTTRGTATDVKGKHHPSVLEPWEDFEDLQAIKFNRVKLSLHPIDAEPFRGFSSQHFIEGLGKKWERKIASEPDLVAWQRPMVEDFVRDVISSVMPGSDVTFDNTTHVLGQNPGNTPEPGQDLYAATAPVQDQKPSKKLPPVPQPRGIDQICVFRDQDGRTDLFMVEEYKAPHKLSKETLRAALQSLSCIDVAEIKDQDTVPVDPDENYMYKAKQLVCMVVTQVYDYLLRGGCTHGCIVTGESVVFLKISDENTARLLYYLTEPNLDATASGELDHSKTVVARLLTFSLMAFESPPRNQEWIREAKNKAGTWVVNTDKMYYETPEKLRELFDKLEWADTSYSPPRKSLPAGPSSPRKTRSSQPRGLSSGCKAPAEGFKDEHDDDSDPDQQERNTSGSPMKPSTSKTSQGKQAQQSSRGSGAAGKQRQRPYCTQACLLGLVQRNAIDENCPNAALHPRGKKGDTHSLTKPVLRDILRQQLTRTMDEDCENLKLQGARGMLFKLSLAEQGYTFVGKATIDRYVPHLQHEGRVYQRLRKLQGHLMPVCLGNVDLDIPWFGIDVELVHMLLLSYGGNDLCYHTIEDEEQQAAEFESIIATSGVKHQDIRSANMLWNEELGRILFIDFEISILKPRQKAPKITSPTTASPKPKTKTKAGKPKTIVNTRALQELSINQVATSSKKSTAPVAVAEASSSPLKAGGSASLSKDTGSDFSPTKLPKLGQPSNDPGPSIPSSIHT
ncbi:MAG: hypothetical protein Q9170_005918 [Blastenia crenularia]